MIPLCRLVLILYITIIRRLEGDTLTYIQHHDREGQQLKGRICNIVTTLIVVSVGCSWPNKQKLPTSVFYSTCDEIDVYG